MQGLVSGLVLVAVFAVAAVAAGLAAVRLYRAAGGGRHAGAGR